MDPKQKHAFCLMFLLQVLKCGIWSKFASGFDILKFEAFLLQVLKLETKILLQLWNFKLEAILLQLLKIFLKFCFSLSKSGKMSPNGGKTRAEGPKWLEVEGGVQMRKHEGRRPEKQKHALKHASSASSACFFNAFALGFEFWLEGWVPS